MCDFRGAGAPCCVVMYLAFSVLCFCFFLVLYLSICCHGNTRTTSLCVHDLLLWISSVDGLDSILISLSLSLCSMQAKHICSDGLKIGNSKIQCLGNPDLGKWFFSGCLLLLMLSLIGAWFCLTIINPLKAELAPQAVCSIAVSASGYAVY